MNLHDLRIDRPVKPRAIEFAHSRTAYPVKAIFSSSTLYPHPERRDRLRSNVWTRLPMQKRRRLSMPSMLLAQMVSNVLFFYSLYGNNTCEGAHSWVRKYLGITMDGDQTGG